MALPIQPIGASPAVAAILKPMGVASPDSFQSLLKGAIGQVEQTGQEAKVTVERFLSGESEEVHQAVVATQKAELSFELFLQMRNKVVQAYQEVMRMQM
jgi:flagellar hook-basal body complex protein FliE